VLDPIAIRANRLQCLNKSVQRHTAILWAHLFSTFAEALNDSGIVGVAEGQSSQARVVGATRKMVANLVQVDRLGLPLQPVEQVSVNLVDCAIALLRTDVALVGEAAEQLLEVHHELELVHLVKLTALDLLINLAQVNILLHDGVVAIRSIKLLELAAALLGGFVVGSVAIDLCVRL
jgi:hypothetical protein